MMNNHFHLQHEHTPQSVAPQFPTATAAAAGPATYSYAAAMPAQPAQWMTYQILPHGQAMATGAAGPAKRFYTTTTTAPAAGGHSNTIQITNNFGGQQPPPGKAQTTVSSSPFKGNNIRIISTAPNVYSLNKAQAELFAPSSTTAAELFTPVTSSTLQSFFLPSGAAGGATPTGLSRLGSSTTAKLLPVQPPPLVPVSGNGSAATEGPPTVVLDRINICINNHYAESAASQPPGLALAAQQQQPSPIIPAIQHKALMPPLIDSSSAADSSCSSSSSSSLSRSGITSTTTASAVIVIDEPDSTTATPNTPPTTPEALSSPLKTPSELESPSPPPPAAVPIVKSNLQSFVAAVLTPPTPPTPPPPPASPLPLPAPVIISYELQEDVFIKCQDGRFYLGTIIDQTPEKYLVRFDDKSEQWCEPEKLRKLGGGSENKTQTSSSTASGPMCVACKRTQHDDVVEICERCGRGYHRGCTTEIAAGSGIWCCKRCAKPMKMQPPVLRVDKPPGICRQLPYHADKLSWDEKHRVNEEQIYCYCGKPGKFDQNMLQCCKCRNWFHTQCLQNFKTKLLRGDNFFVFCCTVCHDGKEFVRRLQIDWVDVLHIALYNLRKHQHQKYHHLLKDIWPFILKHRQQLPICAEWRSLPETALMARIKQTLKDYSERFVCGKEFKRDPSYYALRHSGPPLTPKVFVQPHEKLCDELLVDKFKLLLLPEEGKAKKKDIYEFHTDEEEEFELPAVTVEGETTSDDEIPIKMMMDKAKKQPKSAPQPLKADLVDDNANDGQQESLNQSATLPPVAQPSPLLDLASSRKRKAFRLSKSYKEMAAASSRLCDLSSDENSSSSRGTSSLDHIIPPPVNFLGRNNPFLMATPKKNGGGAAGAGGQQQMRGNGVASGLINTIFKLKNSSGKLGIFPQLNTTELAKAAGSGQARTVRTVKRRLSAKDITIGPNQEVRRRRTRRLTTAVEVINTTTINPIPSHYFPIYAKDLQSSSSSISVNATTAAAAAVVTTTAKLLPPEKPSHGRLLRQRPQKSSLQGPASRRSSTSSTATNGSSSSCTPTNCHSSSPASNHSILDLKQSVNRYFGGAMNRIDAGESFAIRAKRCMGNGHVQYLVEWGGDASNNN